MPRLVRMGRPANDNGRLPGARTRLLLACGLLALAALVVAQILS